MNKSGTVNSCPSTREGGRWDGGSIDRRKSKINVRVTFNSGLCITIATTLLDPLLYPRQEIAELYGVRWQVETHFGELKTTLRMRKVKSKTSQGVLKELVVYALVYNLVHRVMLRAAESQGVMPHRVSFIDAVRWLQCAAPGEPLGDLVINPLRKDRHEPRVIKDRQDTYTSMTRPRAELRKALKKQAKRA